MNTKLKYIVALTTIIQLFLNYSFAQIKNTKDTSSDLNSLKVSANFPKALGFVNDFEKILDSVTDAILKDIIIAHQMKSSDQIAIVTVRNIFPYNDIQKYATDIGNYWGVGQADKNNGVTIVVSKNIRKAAIAVGLGLEQKLPDSTCQRIINNVMIPRFKEGNYDKGLTYGLLELIRVLEK